MNIADILLWEATNVLLLIPVASIVVVRNGRGIYWLEVENCYRDHRLGPEN